MPTIASKRRSGRRSSFGTTCVHCNAYIIAPERSEYRDERQIVHCWRCPKCGYSFEVISVAGTKSIVEIMAKIEAIMSRDHITPSRLIA